MTAEEACVIRGFALFHAHGTNNGPYYVLSSTNVALPLSNWTRLQTNSFDANGNFSFTNTITTP